mgnify:CR=1 FL=1
MASIKDIAKACGVSVATVSKALNGHNDISQATKEKVREAARQIGYMPNSAARALKTVPIIWASFLWTRHKAV